MTLLAVGIAMATLGPALRAVGQCWIKKCNIDENTKKCNLVLAVLIYLVGQLVAGGCFLFVPNMLGAGLATSVIVYAPVAAKVILGEQFTPGVVLSGVCILVGMVLIVLFGPQTDVTGKSLHDLLHMLGSPDALVLYGVAATLYIGATVIACVIHRSKAQLEDGLLGPGATRAMCFSCLINNGISNNIAASGVKALGILIRDKLVQPGVLAFFGMTVAAQVSQIYWMSTVLALPTLDVSVASPLLITVTFLIGQAVGAVVWNELDSVDETLHRVVFGVGLASTLVGCCLMVCEMRRRMAAGSAVEAKDAAGAADEHMHQPFLDDVKTE